jgi:single-strand DNA-binding protein
MNRVVLFGRLGRDPEVRATAENGKVCNLSLATTERFKDRAGEWQEGTEWHRVVAFGRTAETCEQYLAKGREILVEGRLRTRDWEDQAGTKRYTTEVVAANVTFAGGRGGSGAGEDRPYGNGGGRGRVVDLDDEIPF